MNKNKNFLNNILIFLILIFTLISLPLISSFSGDGDGTLESPFNISTCLLLNETRDNLTAHYQLTSNVDCSGWDSGNGFVPIGIDDTNTFQGSLEGNNYNISHLKIVDANGEYAALFSYVNQGNLTNIHLNNISNTDSFIVVGGLAGVVSNALVENCSVTGNINANGTNTLLGTLGGLVSVSVGSIIKNSWADVNVTKTGIGSVVDYPGIGGLVGWIYLGERQTNITDCYATGIISGNHTVGGLIGRVGLVIGDTALYVNNSYATGNVYANNTVGGLIGLTNSNTTIENSYATGNVISANGTAGGLIGNSYGNITDCYSTGNVSASDTAGGLIGIMQGNTSILDSYATGNVTTNINFAGGLAGQMIGTAKIFRSHSSGSILGNRSIGGLVGSSSFNSRIFNCSSSSHVWATDDFAGGLVGYSYGNITYSYATGNVTAVDIQAGGLVGNIYSGVIEYSHATGRINSSEYTGGFAGFANSNTSIDKCYAIGNVYGGQGLSTGGFIGEFRGLINNSYARGNVTNNAGQIGGFAGYIDGGSLYNSYSTGNVTKTAGSYLGGLVGRNNSEGFANCFWDNETYDLLTSAAGTGEITINMKTESTFTSVGWNFDSIWKIDVSINDGYPSFGFAPYLIKSNYTPTDNSSIDPLENITINGILFTQKGIIDTAKLQIKNSSDSWDNLINSYTMDINTITSGIYKGYYVANITFSLPYWEDTINYRIYTNNTESKEENLTAYSLPSYWDCTWNVITSSGSYSFPSLGGQGEELVLGNITFENTGDIEYTNNNCSIVFARDTAGNDFLEGNSYDPAGGGQALNFSASYYLTTSAVSGKKGIRYYYNDTEISNLRVNASTNKTLVIKGIFTSLNATTSILNENPVIPFASSIDDTRDGTNSFNITATMKISPGAYLETAITNPNTDPYYIELVPGIHSFEAYVKNIVSNETNAQNNTAYNVIFNWTLPPEISSAFSYTTLNKTYNKLTNTSKQYLNITLNLTAVSLGPLTVTNYEIPVYTQGYKNSTGTLELIMHEEGIIINDSITIQFYCPNYTAGMTTADACLPTTTTITGGGSGGGGGGTVYLLDSNIESEAEYELVRGDFDSFYLPVENKVSYVLNNLTVSVEGINENLIELTPTKINSLRNGEIKNIEVGILAPIYFDEGKYILTFNITGKQESNTGRKSNYFERRRVTLYILEMSRQDAEKLREEAIKSIYELEKKGFNTKQVNSLFSKLNDSFNTFIFSDVELKANEINQIYDSAIESKQILSELQENVNLSEYRGIDVLETKKLLYLAQISFDRGDYVLAAERLREAQLTYALETKGAFNLYKTVKNNPVQSLAALLAFAFLSFSSSVAVRYKLYKRKLKLLKKEEILLLELMKVVQRDTFEKNKMSMEEYQLSISQYEKRLSETIEKRIRVESKLANLLKIKGKKKALNHEKKRLNELIMDAQERYLNKANIETRVYDNMIKTYSNKLAEVEEELTFIEAKEMLNEGFFSKIKEVFKR